MEKQLGLFHGNFRLSARKLVESHLTRSPQAICKSGDALVACPTASIIVKERRIILKINKLAVIIKTKNH